MNREEIKKIAGALQDATIRLNISLTKVEQVLVEMNLGVYASVSLTSEATLNFYKRDKTWGLFVSFNNNYQIVSLLSSSREIRVLAAHAMPALVQALCEEVERQVSEVSESSEYLDTLIQLMKEVLEK